MDDNPAVLPLVVSRDLLPVQPGLWRLGLTGVIHDEVRAIYRCGLCTGKGGKHRDIQNGLDTGEKPKISPKCVTFSNQSKKSHD